MKKIFVVIFTLIIIVSLQFTTANASTSWTSTENVILPETQNQFNIEISIDNPTAYAGSEFGIQCPDGVTVKSIIYNSETLKAGPVVARGLTWFSFFSGNNDFSGKSVATITLEYGGVENTCISIDNISIYTKNGTAVDTEMLNPKKVITINREGATNTVTPFPEVSSSIIPQAISDDSSDNSNSTTSANPNNNSTNANTTDNQVSSNNKSSSTDKSNDQTITNSQKDTNILAKGDASINTFILVLLILSLGANIGLGYFIIKSKKTNNNKKETC